jgi:hypothetical protein
MYANYTKFIVLDQTKVNWYKDTYNALIFISFLNMQIIFVKCSSKTTLASTHGKFGFQSFFWFKFCFQTISAPKINFSIKMF